MTALAETAYPEHGKMAAIRAELDAIASFLELLEAGQLTYGGVRLHLAVYSGETSTRTQIVGADIPSLLSQWSGIDQNKIEAEKREMLRSLGATCGTCGGGGFAPASDCACTLPGHACTPRVCPDCKGGAS